MSTPEDFLARLDHVVDDYETSDDAMRWMPEPVEPDVLPLRTVTIDTSRDGVTTFPNGSRLYWSTNAEPTDVSGWAELGYTEDGAGSAFDGSHIVRRSEVDWPTPGLWARANPPFPTPGQLLDWQARMLAAYADAGGFGRVGPMGIPSPGPLDHSPEVLTDPDNPRRPLRIVGGLQAQRSPYGPQCHHSRVRWNA